MCVCVCVNLLCSVFGHLVCFRCCVCQVELDLEKGLEMRKWVLSGILASEETYISQLEALLIVRVLFSPCFQS